jgi:hypothetical protein
MNDSMNCIFCKIIAKEIPNHTVYEDDFAYALLLQTQRTNQQEHKPQFQLLACYQAVS